MPPCLKPSLDDGTSPFRTGGDICLGFFREMWDAGLIPMPHGAVVLEVGSAEADWLTPMKAIRPDLHLTGTDQRKIGHRPGADALVSGNLLDRDLFAPASFDVIVAVSVVEHVGIGRYGDPLDPDGDRLVMQHFRHWLRPTGVLYLDVPYRPEGPSTPFRQYNEDDLQCRLVTDWRVEARRHFCPDHPDGPYVALVLRPHGNV